MAITIWRMISAAWDMMTTEWVPRPCILEAMEPCHVWGAALEAWTGGDLGKEQRLGKKTRKCQFRTDLSNSCFSFLMICRSCEDTLDGDMGGVDPYTWGVPMTMERGSMASLDSTLRKAPPSSWRQPELPEVIAMLNYRLDPVKTNAAAYLQHLTFKNDKVWIKFHLNAKAYKNISGCQSLK